jgi:hypothetical protein
MECIAIRWCRGWFGIHRSTGSHVCESDYDPCKGDDSTHWSDFNGNHTAYSVFGCR